MTELPDLDELQRENAALRAALIYTQNELVRAGEYLRIAGRIILTMSYDEQKAAWTELLSHLNPENTNGDVGEHAASNAADTGEAADVEKPESVDGLAEGSAEHSGRSA